MDEPCSALDPIATRKIEELMQELRKRFTIAIVTHNLQQAQRVADYTGFLYVDTNAGRPHRISRRVRRVAADLRGSGAYAHQGVHPGGVQLSRGPAAPIAMVLAMTGVLSGCSAGAVPRGDAVARPKPVVPAGGVLLQGAGATFPSPLYEKWFGLYQADHPKDVITYDGVGSGEGIRRFIGRSVKDEEKIDFGASDAAMRDDEIALVPAGALLLPLTAGSVALAYNLPGSLR